MAITALGMVMVAASDDCGWLVVGGDVGGDDSDRATVEVVIWE